MRIIKTGLFCAGVALAAGNVLAQDMKKDAMTKDAMHPMTMQQCKDQMAMHRTDAMKNDPAMMKKDAACTDMMKKDGSMMKDGAMKGDTKK
ncbi:MAG: hypothetical protein ABI537_08410 [Casimicrobiaceae bacterium]